MADLVLTVACSFQLVLVTDTFKRSGLVAVHDVLATVEQALSEGVEASCVTCQKKHKFNIKINTTGSPTPLQWSIQVDQSAIPGDLEQSVPNCHLRGVKLSTPTFRTNAIYSTSSDGNGHVHQLSYSGMIKAVLQYAHRTIGTLSSGHAAHKWLYAPRDLRMEVCIGNHDLGFLDSTYETVETLTKICSRQIDVMHMGRSHGKTLSTTDAVLRPSTTIDFDQAPSTLHSAQALGWIDVCLSIVRSCADSEQSLDLSSRGPFASPTFSSADLLQALGTSSTTQGLYGSLIASTQTRCEESIAAAMLAMTSGSKTAELALSLANQELKSTSSDAVLANVKVKLLGGAYGKFTDSYLKMALLSLNTDM